MATLIEGDSATFDSLLYGTQPQVTQEFVEQERARFQSFSTPMTVTFFQKAMELETAMRDNKAVQLASAAARKVRSLWQSDDIRRLATVADFQHAPQCMRRFIMAEPEVRNLWQKNLCSGYDDQFEDFREEKGEYVVEYRQVMDGMVIDNPNPAEDEHEWECVTYGDDELENLEPMLQISIDDQFDIVESWDKLKDILAMGKEDPTSEINASL